MVPVAERYESGERAAAAATAAAVGGGNVDRQQLKHPACEMNTPPLSPSQPQTRRAPHPDRGGHVQLPSINNGNGNGQLSPRGDQNNKRGQQQLVSDLSAETVAGLAERVEADMKLNAAVIALNAQRAASVVGIIGCGIWNGAVSVVIVFLCIQTLFCFFVFVFLYITKGGIWWRMRGNPTSSSFLTLPPRICGFKGSNVYVVVVLTFQSLFT